MSNANIQGTDINLAALVGGVFTAIEIVQNPQNGTVVLTAGQAAAAQASVAPGTQTAQATAPGSVAVYTPRPGYTGPDSFQFVAVGPGGRSAAATISLNVIGSPPVVQPKQAETGDDQAVIIDLSGDATQGPFTAAAIVSVSPAESTTARLIEGGTPGNRTYQLSITPRARFDGTITISYTIRNAFGTSAPAVVTVTVTARPDPSLDPTVRALSDAQAESTRRFGQAQITNFMRRNEQLHHPANASSNVLGFRFTARDGSAPFDDTLFRSEGLDMIDRVRGFGDGTVGTFGGAGLGFGGVGGGVGGRGAGLGSYGVAAGDDTRGAAPVGRASAAGSSGRKVGQLAFWTGGAIEIGTRDATTRRDKITASTGGLSGGVDMRIAEDVTIGVGGGYGADRSDIDGGAARVRSNTSVVAAYGSAAPIDGLFIDGLIGYGDLQFSTRRTVGTDIATGSRSGSMWFGALSTGVNRRSGWLLWSAYANLNWIDASLGRYAESGAGRLSLRFDERNVTSLSSVLGGRLGFTQKTFFGSVSPHVRAEWQHEFNGSTLQQLDYADFVGDSQFGFDTVGWQRESYNVALGSRLALPRRWNVDIELSIRGASGESSGQLRLGVSKEF